MKKTVTAIILLYLAGTATSDDVSDSDRLLCSASEVVACSEGGECLKIAPWELDVPQFLIIDTRKKSISTTRVSGEDRSTPITTMSRDDASIFLQGTEQGRAFNFVIDQLTGILTAAVARDGLTVSVFGACTDAEV